MEWFNKPSYEGKRSSTKHSKTTKAKETALRKNRATKAKEGAPSTAEQYPHA
jgi:hypothetical protein